MDYKNLYENLLKSNIQLENQYLNLLHENKEWEEANNSLTNELEFRDKLIEELETIIENGFKSGEIEEIEDCIDPSDNGISNRDFI